jgi:hypothetical protein
VYGILGFVKLLAGKVYTGRMKFEEMWHFMMNMNK